MFIVREPGNDLEAHDDRYLVPGAADLDVTRKIAPVA
jgi:hypothetical protein